MRTAAISEVKNRLSYFLRAVAKGETVTILDRGRPVAVLKPLDVQEAALEDLAADGLARPPLAALPNDFLKRKLPRVSTSIADALADDREDRF